MYGAHSELEALMIGSACRGERKGEWLELLQRKADEDDAINQLKGF